MHGERAVLNGSGTAFFDRPRIVVLNPKGGSGKTTLATHLAACFAARGEYPALIDEDPQGSSMRWLSKRPPERPEVAGISAFGNRPGVTRTFQMRVPPECEWVLVDTPAAVPAQRLPEVTRGAHAVLVPVLPSDIDIHAAARCVHDLLLIAKISRREQRLGIVANRIRQRTRAQAQLMRFLGSLHIPVVATLRDSQNYLRASEAGLGIHELPAWQARADVESWGPLVAWLDAKRHPMIREQGA